MGIYITTSQEIDLLDEIYYLNYYDKMQILNEIFDNLDDNDQFNIIINKLSNLTIDNDKFCKIKKSCNIEDLYND